MLTFMLTYFTQDLVRVERVDVFGTLDNEKLFLEECQLVYLIKEWQQMNHICMSKHVISIFSIKRLANTFCLNQSVGSIDTNQWIVCLVDDIADDMIPILLVLFVINIRYIFGISLSGLDNGEHMTVCVADQSTNKELGMQLGNMYYVIK